MSNNSPIVPIGGIIALITLLSGLFTQKSCNFGCTTASEIPTSRAPRQFQELSSDEKRAAFEQMLYNPEKSHLFLSVLSDDNKFEEFLKNIQADAETVEVLNELRQRHKFKFEVPDEVSVTITEVGETPKFKPAKFKKIKANANNLDTTLSRTQK